MPANNRWDLIRSFKGWAYRLYFADKDIYMIRYFYHKIEIIRLFFVLFYVFLCCSMYCLSCDVPCIVCVYICNEQLPPGGYPIAVKYMSYIIPIISSILCYWNMLLVCCLGWPHWWLPLLWFVSWRDGMLTQRPKVENTVEAVDGYLGPELRDTRYYGAGSGVPCVWFSRLHFISWGCCLHKMDASV